MIGGGDIVLDRSAFPLVHCWFPPVVHDEQIGRFLDAFRAFLDEGHRYVPVIDFSETQVRPNPALRRLAGQFIAELNQRSTVLALAVVFVVPNQLWRGALTAVFWAARPVVPTHVVAHIDEGRAVARGILIGAGLVPA